MVIESDNIIIISVRIEPWVLRGRERDFMWGVSEEEEEEEKEEEGEEKKKGRKKSHPFMREGCVEGGEVGLGG